MNDIQLLQWTLEGVAKDWRKIEKGSLDDCGEDRYSEGDQSTIERVDRRYSDVVAIRWWFFKRWGRLPIHVCTFTSTYMCVCMYYGVCIHNRNMQAYRILNSHRPKQTFKIIEFWKERIKLQNGLGPEHIKLHLTTASTPPPPTPPSSLASVVTSLADPRNGRALKGNNQTTKRVKA